MARTRTVKIGLFQDEELADLDLMARLLFIGLWLLADREGRLEDRPRRIKGLLFPYEACDTETHLGSLHDAGFIFRYSVDGSRYIQIVHFVKHQNPHPKEAASIIPAPFVAIQAQPEQEIEEPCNYMESNVISRKSHEKLPGSSIPSIPSIPSYDPGDSSQSAEVSPVELPVITTSKRTTRSPNGDPYAYAHAIAEALGYGDYPNKGEACKMAKDCLRQGVDCQEMIDCGKFMLETNESFWVSQTIQIQSIVRQLPAYRKAVAAGGKPGSFLERNVGGNNGKYKKHLGPQPGQSREEYYGGPSKVTGPGERVPSSP
jgi:hypothetical protein